MVFWFVISDYKLYSFWGEKTRLEGLSLLLLVKGGKCYNRQDDAIKMVQKQKGLSPTFFHSSLDRAPEAASLSTR